MRFIAFDLETTGLDPQTCQIIQIGAVAFDSDDMDTPVAELPCFARLVRNAGSYHGDLFCTRMNRALLDRILDGEGSELEDALDGFSSWVQTHSPGWPKRKANAVGFNVAAFDIAFLKRAGRDLFHHRPVELGSVFLTPAGPATSNELTKIHLGRDVKHDALQDARDAVSLFRVWRRDVWPKWDRRDVVR